MIANTSDCGGEVGLIDYSAKETEKEKKCLDANFHSNISRGAGTVCAAICYYSRPHYWYMHGRRMPHYDNNEKQERPMGPL